MGDCGLFGERISPYLFRQTRIIPLDELKELIGEVVEYAARMQTIRRVLDVGCGCGRLLEGIVDYPGIYEILGVDISEKMLRSIKPWVKKKSNVKLMEADFAQSSVKEHGKFDIVIMHWVLNSTEAWEDILKNVISIVNEKGIIAWFDEDSNLYNAIDGNVDEENANNWSDFEHDLWRCWYKALGDNGQEEFLRSRYGVPLKSKKADSELKSNGYNIVRLQRATRQWTCPVSAQWIVDNVIAKRAFSNLWKVDELHYEKSVNTVKSFVARYEQSVENCCLVNFKSTPVVALKDKIC